VRESELHKHIEARSLGLRLATGHTLILGPGDDAALYMSPSGDRVVVSVDQLVEGRHYEPGTDTDLVARKAIARSVSDLAAMGATPSWGLATALLPEGDPGADALFDAMARWAVHWGAPLIGGDLASWGAPDSPRVLTTTIGGVMESGHDPVTRSGARSGDLVYLTGQVGGSLESGWHLRFEPRLAHGRWASRKGSGASAMIDLSDGLGRDADRVACASGVVMELEAAALPISHRSASWRDACAEGEDYELLICVDPRTDVSATGLEPALLGPVGVCRACACDEDAHALLIDPHGERHAARELGWEHGSPMPEGPDKGQ